MKIIIITVILTMMVLLPFSIVMAARWGMLDQTNHYER